MVTYPIAGRLVLRRLKDGSGSLLGVLRFSPEIALAESAGYLLEPEGSLLRVLLPAYLAELPAGVAGYGIDHLLRQPHWPVFLLHPDRMMVRLVGAFPEQNLWTVYGTSRYLPVFGSESAAGHAWFDVSSVGELRAIAPPADGRGLTCAQLLTELGVWPDATGQLHHLPQHPTGWRSVYHRLSELTAQVGEGHLSEREFYQRIASDADPDLRCAAPFSIDLSYARYLARLKALDGLRLSSPITTEERERQQSLSRRIVRELALA